MTKKTLLELFSKAFCEMLREDSILLEMGNPVQERTLVFRFALYLHQYIVGEELDKCVNGVKLKLDVEYNRDGDDVKRIDSNSKWNAPDIIFHERRSGAFQGDARHRNDIFCCEIKKDDFRDGDDSLKVRKYMENMKYKFGIVFCKFTCEEAKFDLYYKKRKAGNMCVEAYEYCKNNTNTGFRKTGKRTTGR